MFTYEQQKRICKFLKIKLESTLTEISYDGWLYLYDVFLKFVSNEKKAIILNAEQDMKNNQNKIQKNIEIVIMVIGNLKLSAKKN